MAQAPAHILLPDPPRRCLFQELNKLDRPGVSADDRDTETIATTVAGGEPCARQPPAQLGPWVTKKKVRPVDKVPGPDASPCRQGHHIARSSGQLRGRP